MNRELATAFDGFEARRQAFLADLARRPPASLELRPGASAWSLAELAQHLWLVERGTVNVLADRLQKAPLRRGLLSRLGVGMAAIRFVLGRFRIKVPVKAILPKPGVPIATVRTEWDATRERLRAVLESVSDAQVHQPYFRHPLAGALTVAQTMEFLTLHHDHHLGQVERITRGTAGAAGGEERRGEE